jgi:peptidoglycan/xylan/chitin deacetylase (PgdA/CDA1 family)
MVAPLEGLAPARPSRLQAQSDEATSAPKEAWQMYDRPRIHALLGQKRQVLLTFDDGPHPEITPRILSILRQRGLKAVFFLIGINVRKYPNIVRQIAAEGHTIGNHTFSHPNLARCSAERVQQEIRQTNDLIEQITGIRPTLCRPPYGGLSASAIEVLRQEGMSIMLWNIDPSDWRHRNTERTLGQLRRQLRLDDQGRGGVVLMHDILSSTAAALEPFLTALAQHDLRPISFADMGDQRRLFWAARHPILTSRIRRTEFRPEILNRPLLATSLRPAAPQAPTSLELLQAKKRGTLWRLLAQRSVTPL